LQFVTHAIRRLGYDRACAIHVHCNSYGPSVVPSVLHSKINALRRAASSQKGSRTGRVDQRPLYNCAFILRKGLYVTYDTSRFLIVITRISRMDQTTDTGGDDFCNEIIADSNVDRSVAPLHRGSERRIVTRPASQSLVGTPPEKKTILGCSEKIQHSRATEYTLSPPPNPHVDGRCDGDGTGDEDLDGGGLSGCLHFRYAWNEIDGGSDVLRVLLGCSWFRDCSPHSECYDDNP